MQNLEEQREAGIADALAELASAIGTVSGHLSAVEGSRDVDVYSRALLVTLHDASRYAELLAEHLSPASHDAPVARTVPVRSFPSRRGTALGAHPS